MRIPQHIVDQIYRAADIVEVISDYLPLKKRGQNYWALSPFKNESTPSFSVSPNKQIFKDFSSGKGGGVVTFLMEMEGCSYLEALRHLAKKYNIEIPEEAEATGEPDHRASLQALATWAGRWFEEQLQNTPEGKTIGLSYLRERGFNPETIRAFGLGYSPEQWDALTQAALKAQFKPEFLTESGLSLVKEDSGARYDRFRGRIIFPIHDVSGKVVGFAGRILKKDAKAAKYVNSPESDLYHKSRILYGLHLAKQAIRSADHAILVEGYTDLISLYQAGVQHVVASSGTALTEEQLRLLGRYTKQLTVVYDGDSAGTRATLRALELGLSAGLNVKALHLPEGHDPDSFVKAEGGTAFRAYLEAHGQDFVQYTIAYSPAGPGENAPERTTRLAREIAGLLAALPDPLSRSAYIRYIAEKLGIEESSMLPVINQAIATRAKQAQRPLQQAPLQVPPGTDEPEGTVILGEAPETVLQPGTSTYHQERELLRLMLNYYEAEITWEETTQAPQSMMAYLSQELGEVGFGHQLLEALRRKIFTAFTAGEPLPHPEQLAEPGTLLAQLVTELLSEPHALSDNWEKRHVLVPAADADLAVAVRSALQYYKARRIRQLFQESLEAIKQAAPEDLERLLKRHKRLQELYKQVHGELGTVVPG